MLGLARKLGLRLAPRYCLAATSQLRPPVSFKQEGILLERLPKELCDPAIISAMFAEVGISTTPADVLIMKSRLGHVTGRAAVLCKELPNGDFSSILPEDSKTKLADQYEIELFVEQCERYDQYSEDLRYLARPEHLNRIVTLVEVPRTYGRLEVAEMLTAHSGVSVAPQNIVFRFRENGSQSDMAWVVAPSEKAASQMVTKVQECAVPRRVQYGNLFGCSFVWATRLSMFISDTKFDYLLLKEDPQAAKCQVYSTGWHEEITVAEFENLMRELHIPICGPTTPHVCAATGKKGFFMTLDNVQNAKRALKTLSVLKKRWRMHPAANFAAYPRAVDVRWSDEMDTDKYNFSDDDSDLDEEIHY